MCGAKIDRYGQRLKKEHGKSKSVCSKCNAHREIDVVAIKCQLCGTTGPYKDDLKEAVEVWNKRA